MRLSSIHESNSMAAGAMPYIDPDALFSFGCLATKRKWNVPPSWTFLYCFWNNAPDEGWVIYDKSPPTTHRDLEAQNREDLEMCDNWVRGRTGELANSSAWHNWGNVFPTRGDTELAGESGQPCMMVSFWPFHIVNGEMDKKAIINGAIQALRDEDLISDEYYVSTTEFGTVPIGAFTVAEKHTDSDEFERRGELQRDLHLMGQGKVGVLQKMGWKPKANPTPGKKWWALHSEDRHLN